MTCDDAANLISARVDGELPADDAPALDAHLAGCAACRAAAEAAEVQDAALLRAFANRRDVAAGLADRVVRKVARDAAQDGAGPRSRFPPRPARWLAWAGAVAAGIVVAVIVLGPHGRSREANLPPTAEARPVAQLTLATGKVFTCPSGAHDWQPLAPGGAVAAGGRVRTADAAKCELELAGGGRVRLNADTEACFGGGRDVRVAAGQVWSAVPPDAAPVRLTAGRATVTAGGPGDPSGAQFDLACAADAATVTVLAGTARAAGGGLPAAVRPGQSVRLPAAGPGAAGDAACVPVADPLAATQWQDELLVRKPGDDPEVVARVGQLLARIAAERPAAAAASPTTGPAASPAPSPATVPATFPAMTCPGPVEADVRARGDAWAAPMACYVRGRPAVPPAERRAAARLLADLAPPWCIPDLIDLLADADGEVRSHAASALRRLTGRDVGPAPGLCATDRPGPAAVAAWRAWWEANKGRYPPRPG